MQPVCQVSPAIITADLIGIMLSRWRRSADVQGPMRWYRNERVRQPYNVGPADAD